MVSREVPSFSEFNLHICYGSILIWLKVVLIYNMGTNSTKGVALTPLNTQNLPFQKSLQGKIQKGHFQPYITTKLGLPPPVTSDTHRIKSVKVRMFFSNIFFSLAISIADARWPEPSTTPYIRTTYWDHTTMDWVLTPKHSLALTYETSLSETVTCKNFIQAIAFWSTFIKKKKVLILSQ
jgi:hypothetical protein